MYSSLRHLEEGCLFAQKYRIVRVIGQGGMGLVYEVEREDIRQRFALKLMHPDVASEPGFARSFALEASVFGRVPSEHIVRPVDAGYDKNSRSYFLLMDLLHGLTLEQLVRANGSLSPRRALSFLEQVARGLDCAHQYEDPPGCSSPIVHRDLKPANLFVIEPDSRSPLVKILDFGLAKIAGDSTRVTTELKGTCAYMAYEQAVGAPVSPQTDIWALGLTAHYLLTGTSYWRSQLPKELLAEIIHQELGPASARLRERNVLGSLPSAFDAWLGRCLRRNPKDRFPSAGQAIEELHRALRVAAVVWDHPLCAPSVAAGVGGAAVASVPTTARGEESAQRLSIQPAALSPRPSSTQRRALAWLRSWGVALVSFCALGVLGLRAQLDPSARPAAQPVLLGPPVVAEAEPAKSLGRDGGSKYDPPSSHPVASAPSGQRQSQAPRAPRAPRAPQAPPEPPLEARRGPASAHPAAGGRLRKGLRAKRKGAEESRRSTVALSRVLRNSDGEDAGGAKSRRPTAESSQPAAEPLQPAIPIIVPSLGDGEPPLHPPAELLPDSPH